jgi:hypothetical protein
LLRLAQHHQAIPHTNLVATAAAALPLIEQFRKSDGSLRIPARELGQIGWDHFVPQWRSWDLTDDFEMMSNGHYLYARGADRIHIHCAHQNAAWIGPKRCKLVEAPLGGTIDSELPRYMGAHPYATRLEDEMVALGLGSTDPPVGKVPFAEYKAEFWRFIGNNRDFIPYFAQPCPVPLATVDHAYPSADHLQTRINRLMERLETP